MLVRFATALASVLVATCLSAPALAGGVFKCVDADGHVTFSFVSCPEVPDPGSATPELTEDEQRAQTRAKLHEIQRRLDDAHGSIRGYQRAQDSALMELESNVNPEAAARRRALRERYRELIGEQLRVIDELRREKKEFASSAGPGAYHS